MLYYIPITMAELNEAAPNAVVKYLPIFGRVDAMLSVAKVSSLAGPSPASPCTCQVSNTVVDLQETDNVDGEAVDVLIGTNGGYFSHVLGQSVSASLSAPYDGQNMQVDFYVMVEQ